MSAIAAIWASVSLLAASDPASAQTTSDDATAVEDIIVDGRRLEELARSYVEQLSYPPPGASLARWNRPICLSISNMLPELAQFVIDRVAINALEAGVDVGGPGCKPNVIIFATSDGQALARRLVSEFSLGFRPAAQHTNPPRAALREFQNSEQPVRWWNVAIPLEATTGEIATRMHGDTMYPDGGPNPAAVRVRDGSRLRSNVRYDMAWTVIIIDMSKTNGVPLGVLADYVSMVSLAQVDPSADLTGQQTIMSLFHAGSSVRGLTSWDKDYLAALYSARPDRINPRSQEAAVTRSLIRQRRAEGDRDRAESFDASDQP